MRRSSILNIILLVIAASTSLQAGDPDALIDRVTQWPTIVNNQSHPHDNDRSYRKRPANPVFTRAIECANMPA